MRFSAAFEPADRPADYALCSSSWIYRSKAGIKRREWRTAQGAPAMVKFLGEAKLQRKTEVMHTTVPRPHHRRYVRQ